MSDPSRALAKLLDAAQKGALLAHSDALAKATGIVMNAALLPPLLRACAENHLRQCVEYGERQNPPPRPKRHRPKTGHPYLDWMLARDEDDFEFYAEDWDDAFKRVHSNDGHNRNNPDGPPVTPLYHLHLMLTLFYHYDLRMPFAPQLVRDEKMLRGRETPRDRLVTVLAESNDAFRLFYFTARHVDPDYRLENCNAVLEGLKKKNLSPEAKAKRQAFMRDYMRARRQSVPPPAKLGRKL